MILNTLQRYAILLLLLGCAVKPLYRKEIGYPSIQKPLVTVKVLETEEEVTVRSLESMLIRGYRREGNGSVHYSPPAVALKLSEGAIALADKTRGALQDGWTQVSLAPTSPHAYLYLNGKPYRGALEVLPVPASSETDGIGSLMVLNVVCVEDYLKGVVPAEIGALSGSEIEALKAQAVAARTYALSRLGQYAEWGYDLEATVEDQVYNGVEGENPLVSRAIRETEGLVLFHGGRPIDAYYHANCGGRTAYIERIWDKPRESYLIPVEDDYCRWAESYRWEETWSTADLEANISSFLDTLVTLPDGGIGELLDLRIDRRSPSGRVEVLEVSTTSGRYAIYRDAIRWAMRRGDRSDRILRSTLFDLEIERRPDNTIRHVTAEGYGTGHGVGMCQTGAIGMARSGYAHPEILKHFYSGARLRAWED